MDIPDSDQSILTSGYQVLTVRRDGATKYLVIMALKCLIKLPATEEEFLLRFKIPFDQRTVLASRDETLIILSPIHACNG